MSRTIFAFSLALLVLACDPAGGPVDGGGSDAGRDAGTDAGQTDGGETDAGVEPGTPTITQVTPVDGSKIGPGQPLTLTFSEPMDPASVTLGGTLASVASPAWTSSTQLTLSPVSGWPASSGAADLQTLTLSASSAEGVALAAPAALSYLVDATPPQLVTTTPADGAALGMGSAIVIRFDEPVTPGSLGTLQGTLAAHVGSAAFSQTAVANDTLTLSPTSSWPDGADHTLTVPAGLTDAVGNPAPAVTLTFDVDAIAPTLSASVPTNGTLIAWDDGLQLTFSEPLSDSTGDHSVAGTLVGAGFNASVSGATLTLTPDGTWNADSDRTLDVVVRDVAGNASATIALTYDVLDGAIYVHKAGADSNPGTQSEPKLTIANGLSAATANGVGEVRVAEGTYNENQTVPSGVRLLGGYDDASWSTPPSRSLYPTVITEPRSITFPYTVDLSPNSSLERFKVVSHASASGCSAVRLLQATTGTQQVIDNELEARNCGEANNIRATNDVSAVEIRGNKLTATSVTSTHRALRLLINGGAPPNVLIEDNEILVSTTAALSRGVEVSPNTSHAASGTITLRNNFIRGGSGTNTTSGRSYGCELTMNNLTYILERNRIHGGTGNLSTHGVYVSGTGQTTQLIGNVIHGGAPATDTSDSWGAQLSGQAKVWNNLITGGGRIGAGTTDGDSHALELFTPGASIINNVLHHGFLKRGAAIRNNSAGVIVRNNIFLSGGAIPGGLVIAVREMNASADFAELRNNRFDGFGDAGHYRFSDSVAGGGNCPGFATYACYSTESDLNNESLTTQGLAGTADSNTVGSAGFEDVDGPDNSLTTLFDAAGVVENRWWLSTGSTIKTSGLDGSPPAGNFGFETDLTGALRSGNGATGWSIGAYENDS